MNIEVDDYDLRLIKYGLKLVHRDYVYVGERELFERLGFIVEEKYLLALRDRLEKLNNEHTS